MSVDSVLLIVTVSCGLWSAFIFLLALFRLQQFMENRNGIRYRPPSINVHQLWSQENNFGNYVDPEN